MKRSLKSQTLRACVLGSVLGSMTAVNADVLLSDWTDEDHFYYYLSHMPDFDQRRCDDMEPSIEGLENDGLNHCVPSATTNVLKYIAQHGFPHIEPGPTSWASGFSYNAAGEFIEELGDDMDTNPWSGTNYEDYYAEIVNRLECEFVVKLYIADDGYSPDFKGLARSAINGHLILVRYGYYNDNGMAGEYHKVSRSGGHMTTFMQAWGWEGTEIMTVRDPATGGNDCYTQSDYTARSWQVEERLVEVDGDRRMQCFLYEDGDYSGSNRYLDGYISIIPNRFYSWGEYDNGMRVIAPIDDLFGHQVRPIIEAPEEWVIRDYLPDPRSLRSLAVLEKANQHLVVELGPDTTSMPTNMISERLLNPHIICWGNQGSLWAADSGQLKVMRRKAETGEWALHTAYDLQSPVDSMVSDPVNGGMYTLHATTRHLMYWPNPDSDDQPRYIGVPPEPKFQPGADLHLNPATGELFIWSAEMKSLWALEFVPGQNDMVATEQLIPDMETITDVKIDELGRLLAARNGKLVAHKRADQGAWTVDESHRFNGLALGDGAARFTMLRSSTNVNGDMDADEMDNQPDTPQNGMASNEVLDCNADLNFDRNVDINDLLTLLSRWGGQGGLGDIVHDRQVDVMDLLALIEAWGACE
ncbi:MAG: hypothetical protein MK095_07960 [Phycisphaerales bacterium]|nr:hypothetical protein [Phycisphaerales bacterium]